MGLDVPDELVAFVPPGPSMEANLQAFKAWSAKRRAFVDRHGLPRTWWWFHTWPEDAQRQFLDAGGVPPPRREVAAPGGPRPTPSRSTR